MSEEVRIDKWLWAVRLYKTRSLATEACRAGKVKHNGMPIKSSHTVKVGDVYELTIEQLHKVVEVKALLCNRVGAKLVPDYLIDLTPAEEYERIQMIRQYNFERRDRGTGRPTKRERRDIDEFKYGMD
ncbi:MAG: RNA-binding S4 domain-containing protein [Bacteroidales bacterium]|nr:RNA-binding S4 domain-containing protein [Bacteroidales bacterium]